MSIDSDPEGASIYVDGSFIGTTPLSYNVPLGNHTLLAKKNEYIESSKSVSIAAEGDQESVYFDLMPVVSKFVDND